ncbi:MAG: LuxR C-terminal-related transcriptional regulator [Nocardioides sp.]
MSTTGRADELQRLRAHVLERRAVLVVGPPGAGRTHVLEALADQLTGSGTEHCLLRGSDSEAGMPLVPFAPLLSRFGVHLSPEGGQGALDVYTRLPAQVRAAGLTVLVDDLHLLTRASQVLLAQLARAGVALVATVPGLEDVPRAILDDLGTRGGWGAEHLGPLSDDAVLAMAADRLGDELSAPSAALLLRYAGGNPLVVRELLAGAAGTTTTGPAGATLGRLRVTPRLTELVDQRLAHLDPAAREVVELLAIAGPLPFAALPGVPVEWLLHHALLTRTEQPAPGAVELVDGLARGVLRDGADPTRTTEALTRGVAAASGRDGWEDVEVHLRSRLDGQVPLERVLGTAAREVARGATSLALDLLRRVEPDHAHVAELRLLLGSALSAEGRLDEADSHLVAATEAADADDQLLTRAGQELGLLLAVRAQRPAEAVERVSALAARVGDEGLRRVLHGDLVKWRLMAGMPLEEHPGTLAGRDASPVGRDAAAVAEVNDAVIGAMIASLDGSPTVTRELVVRGTGALRRTDAVPAYVGDLLRLSHYLADAFDGRLAEAEEVAHAHRRRAATEGDPCLGMWEYATAELALHAGRVADARALADRARRHLAWRDFTGLGAAAIALRAAVAAREGDQATADRLAAELKPEQASDVKVELHLARVRAQRHLLRGDETAAGDELAQAGLLAVEQSHRHLGLMAIDEAVLVHPASAGDRGALIAEHVHPDAALGPVLLRRAQAVAAQDPVALCEVAEDLARMGLHGRAASCLATARSLLERSGRAEAARKAHLRQLTVLADHGATPWPPTDQPALLSPRELEVARLAAARLRSKEIADRCRLSVRTVDNHLARVYRKLGVTGRDDLPDALAALGGTVAGTPHPGEDADGVPAARAGVEPEHAPAPVE